MEGGLLDVEAKGLGDLNQPVDDESANLHVLRANLQMLLLVRLLLLAPRVNRPQNVGSVKFVQLRVPLDRSEHGRACLREVGPALVAVDQVRVSDLIGLLPVRAPEINDLALDLLRLDADQHVAASARKSRLLRVVRLGTRLPGLLLAQSGRRHRVVSVRAFECALRPDHEGVGVCRVCQTRHHHLRGYRFGILRCVVQALVATRNEVGDCLEAHLRGGGHVRGRGRVADGRLCGDPRPRHPFLQVVVAGVCIRQPRRVIVMKLH